MIAIGTHFMHIMAPAFGFFGIQMVMSGALAGAGNTLAAMSLSILAFWVLRFPVAWVLAIPGGLGPDGIFWSFPISNVLAGAIALGWFLRGSWIRRVVDEECGPRRPSVSNTGQPIQLLRPLDFLVVTDHSDYMGLGPMVQDADPRLLADEHGAWLYERFNSGPEGAMEAFRSILDDVTSGIARFDQPEALRSIWESYLRTAEEYYEPGSFSAMTGFEFTSTPSGNNLHRVVVFRDAVDRTSRLTPFSIFDSEGP